MTKYSLLGVRVSAMLESLLFLLTLFAIDLFFGAGTRFISVFPHPLWAIVLLVVFQYGLPAGLLSALLCSLFLFSGEFPDFNHVFELISSRHFQLPLLWIFTAVSIGWFRSGQLVRKKELKARWKKQSSAVLDLSDRYKRLKSQKENLETRLAGELQNSISIYGAVKALDSLNPVQILMELGDVARRVLKAEALSVLIPTEIGFTQLTAEGWSDDDSWSKQIDFGSDLYKELTEKKRILCCVNRPDRELLQGTGVLVSPLLDPETEMIFGVLKVESMRFMNLNERAIETMKVLSEWIGNAYLLAKSYQKVKAENIFNSNDDFYSYRFLRHQKQVFSRLPHYKASSDLIRATIRIANFNSFSETEKKLIGKRLRVVAEKLLPEYFLFTEGAKVGRTYSLLFPTLNIETVDRMMVSFIQRLAEEKDDLLNQLALKFKLEVFIYEV